MRSMTERAEAVDAGVAVIVGTDADRIVAASTSILADTERRARMSRPSNAFGDGSASERILEACDPLAMSAKVSSSLAGATDSRPHADDGTAEREVSRGLPVAQWQSYAKPTLDRGW